jgi:hypothetical protein
MLKMQMNHFYSSLEFDTRKPIFIKTHRYSKKVKIGSYPFLQLDITKNKLELRYLKQIRLESISDLL